MPDEKDAGGSHHGDGHRRSAEGSRVLRDGAEHGRHELAPQHAAQGPDDDRHEQPPAGAHVEEREGDPAEHAARQYPQENTHRIVSFSRMAERPWSSWSAPGPRRRERCYFTRMSFLTDDTPLTC